MLKSLEKLRDGGIWGEDSFGFSQNKAKQLADEIQAEIDKFYLPRPLFEDGEPVQFGDEFLGYCAHVGKVWSITLFDDGDAKVSQGGITDRLIKMNEPVPRPPEKDTQEKIDEDLQLMAQDYCRKYGLKYGRPEEALHIVMRKHLLARQRKLDGVE